MKAGEKISFKKELIGCKIEIIKSNNACDEGMKGRISDETKNTLVVETKDGNKRLLKNNIIIKTVIDGKVVEIPGKNIQGKPKDRIKNK